MKEDLICKVLPFRKRYLTLGDTLSNEQRMARTSLYKIEKPEYIPFYTKPKKKRSNKKKKGNKHKKNRNVSTRTSSRLNRQRSGSESRQEKVARLKQIKEENKKSRELTRTSEFEQSPSHPSPTKQTPLSPLKTSQNKKEDSQDAFKSPFKMQEQGTPRTPSSAHRHNAVRMSFMSREDRAKARQSKKSGDVTQEELNIIKRDNLKIAEERKRNTHMSDDDDDDDDDYFHQRDSSKVSSFIAMSPDTQDEEEFMDHNGFLSVSMDHLPSQPNRASVRLPSKNNHYKPQGTTILDPIGKTFVSSPKGSSLYGTEDDHIDVSQVKLNEKNKK
mmetsp:Transcript_12192/g.18164  ORF Transcript_12192/g.18164 Transcript_12192/m.18164 type:complete len:330 (+) Transcript_12192:148-1137(+)